MTAHIVVLEDEPAVLEMLCAALESEGLVVTPVAFPNLNVNAWPRQTDVFLIDCMLPHHDGVETAAWLAAHGFRDTPKICMSASSQVLREASNSPLFQAVLAKPFDLSELVDTIGCLLANPSVERPA